MNLLQTAQSELLSSNTDPQHPFRYFYLATLDHFPEIRTVVKRHISPDWTLYFFTDLRSPKVSQIQASPGVSALFYHPQKQIQVRIKGRGSVLSQGKEYDAYLEQVRTSNGLRDYMSSLAPGSPLPKESIPNDSMELHFAVVQILPEELDILQLNTDQHLRSRYVLRNGDWEETPLIP